MTILWKIHLEIPFNTMLITGIKGKGSLETAFVNACHSVRHLHSRMVTLPPRSRVVITGMGVVSCLGVGANHVWERLLEGKCGIRNVIGEGFEKIPCQVAGYVPRGTGESLLNLEEHFSKRQLKEMSLGSAYAVVAAGEALSHARWSPTTEEEKASTGVAVGMGMVGLDDVVTTGDNLRQKGYNKVSPFFIPRILINMPAGYISQLYGLQGPNHAVSTACTTGLHAIGDATRFIQSGDAKVMICGGTEASINPFAFAGFCRLRALSTKFNDAPSEASRPYDKHRDGFVMSEGSAILVLEELNHAKNRGAEIIAEVLGYGLSGDAHHITAPPNDGQGAYRCMQSALRNACLDPSDIGYINTHATSTPQGDSAEASAISRLFGSQMKVSSTKGAVGHLLGAAGAIETVFTALACQQRKLPHTLNLNDVDSPVELDYLRTTGNETYTNTDGNLKALTNSFGFGGTNASLCIGRFCE
ncbi:3-oxoacyl-[acyl-carrier-protein] synthase, mitochondrial-like [Tubulanus polymorphus]|uniref:3-oxoacyl-[acyl-carrier-protein] synthase, mitochondrial-like n=1 Tax=Tubulanus polymorphus TaxID=672921 RepID=UPI003DA1F613